MCQVKLKNDTLQKQFSKTDYTFPLEKYIEDISQLEIL